MTSTKVTVRRLPTFVAAPGQRIGNENIRGQGHTTFKLNKPHTKTIEVKKSSRLVRKINVGRILIISRTTEECSFKLETKYVY